MRLTLWRSIFWEYKILSDRRSTAPIIWPIWPCGGADPAMQRSVRRQSHLSWCRQHCKCNMPPRLILLLWIAIVVGVVVALSVSAPITAPGPRGLPPASPPPVTTPGPKVSSALLNGIFDIGKLVGTWGRGGGRDLTISRLCCGCGGRAVCCGARTYLHQESRRAGNRAAAALRCQ